MKRRWSIWKHAAAAALAAFVLVSVLVLAHAEQFQTNGADMVAGELVAIYLGNMFAYAVTWCCVVLIFRAFRTAWQGN